MSKSPKPLSQIIEESVQGVHDAWPIDPAYPAEGTFEDRFNAGDKEIVLWEIYRCAKGGTSIPEWAAKAFCDSLIRIAKCELSWEKFLRTGIKKQPFRD
jgi:hypothetical protein